MDSSHRHSGSTRSRPTPTFLEQEAAAGKDRDDTIPWAVAETPATIRKEGKTDDVDNAVSPRPDPKLHCAHIHVSVMGVGDLGVRDRDSGRSHCPLAPPAHHHHHPSHPVLAPACHSPTPSHCCPPTSAAAHYRGCPASPQAHPQHRRGEDHGLWGARCGVSDQPAMCGAGVLHFVDDTVTYTTCAPGEDPEHCNGSPRHHHHH